MARLLRHDLGLLAIAVLLGVGFLSLANAQSPDQQVVEQQEASSVLDNTVNTISGDEITLQDYAGQVLLIVNVASRCGLTPQYEQLQSLYSKYADQGLAVLGFPCNQFGGQEPGTSDEIQQFCSSKYSVTFPMFEKINVNGDEATNLYKQLTALDLQPAGSGKISWNFEKFVVGRDGQVVARFGPRTSPNDAKLVEVIETQLERGN